jgi:hypothetical protein
MAMVPFRSRTFVRLTTGNTASFVSAIRRIAVSSG